MMSNILPVLLYALMSALTSALMAAALIVLIPKDSFAKPKNHSPLINRKVANRKNQDVDHYHIVTIKGKIVSFDRDHVTLEVDGHKATVLRSAFPTSQKFIYNETATAYYKLLIN